MPLVPFGPMLEQARKEHYTIGALNILNMETLQAVIKACEQKNVGVIAQVYHAHLRYAGADYIAAMGKVAGEKASIPVSISLDHGQSYEMAEECILAGFTGVMIDLASSDYDTNVEQTKKVVALAKKYGVSVEAELGTIHDASAPLSVRNTGMTDPDVAARFVQETGIDALAVAIGTAHGFYSSTPKIDFDRLDAILRTVKCPIVVHGGSNTPDEDIMRMVEMGISKLNIGTDLMAAYESGLRDAMAGGSYVDLMQVLEAGRENEMKTVLHKLDLLTHCRVKK